MNDQVVHNRIIAVQSIAAPAEIVIISFGGQKIIDIVIQPLERDIGTVFIAFRRVIKHHVQDHFDSILVQFPDQGFELIVHTVIGLRTGIAGVGCEIAYGVISPVIQQPFPIYHTVVPAFVKLKDRHQLHRVDPQLFEISDLLPDPFECTGIFYLCRRMLRKTADMELIDDQILKIQMGLVIFPPVKRIVDDFTTECLPLIVRLPLSPDMLTGHQSGVRV